MQTTRCQMFSDGALATVTTRIARQGVTGETEETYPVRAGEDPENVIPYADLRAQANDVVDRLVDAREALMRSGYAASCALPNTLAVCIPGGTFPRVATLYGGPSGLGISGQMAETLARILEGEGVEVRVD